MWHQSHQCKLSVILAGNLFLLSNTVLRLAIVCVYRLYEIESTALLTQMNIENIY